MAFRFVAFCTMALFVSVPAVVFAFVPNDPFVSQQSYELTNVYEAWDQVTGSRDVVVAVIDNGFDTFHPDLRENVWKNEDEIANNGIDDDNNGFIDDVYGWNFFAGNNDPRPNVGLLSEATIESGSLHHATVVASIIGAKGDNNQAGAGINWNVRLMNIKILGSNGEGHIANFFDAIQYAVDNGADVINISLISNFDSGVTEAIQYAYDHNVVVVAAAGNDNVHLNFSPQYPVCGDLGSSVTKVLGVSAISPDRRIAEFSNVGSDCVDITAPGVDIGGAVRFSPSAGLTDKFMNGWEGTSFAAPFVSGAAALVKSIQPTWHADDIYKALLSTIDKTPTNDEAAYANLFGKGLLQIDKAVAYALAESGSVVAPKSSPMLVFFDEAAGGVRLLDLAASTDTTVRHPQLAGTNGMTMVRDNGELRYVVSKSVGPTASEITVYTRAFRKVRSWVVPLGGALDLVAGNVHGTATSEIIVSPQSASTDVFRVYSLDGKLVKRVFNIEGHTGARVSVVSGEERWEEIVVSTAGDRGVDIVRYDTTFSPSDSFTVQYLRAAGDVDVMVAGRQSYYVVAAGEGDRSFVGVHTSDGKLVRRFYGADKTYRGGLSMTVSDYTGDGVRDIVVGPSHAGQDARVYTLGGKQVTTVAPFASHRGVQLFSL